MIDGVDPKELTVDKLVDSIAFGSANDERGERKLTMLMRNEARKVVAWAALSDKDLCKVISAIEMFLKEAAEDEDKPSVQ